MICIICNVAKNVKAALCENRQQHELEAQSIGGKSLRLSIGLEATADIILDLGRALR